MLTPLTALPAPKMIPPDVPTKLKLLPILALLLGLNFLADAVGLPSMAHSDRRESALGRVIILEICSLFPAIRSW